MKQNTVYPPELFAGKDYNNASGGNITNRLITKPKNTANPKKKFGN